MKSRLLLTIAALVCLPIAASAQWSDNFDAYAAGSPLHGQGGWHGWDGSAAATGYVSAALSVSAPHSAEIIQTSDLVQEFSGYTSGYWIFRCMQYIPTGSTGSQYIILLNQYADFGPYNWSTEIEFNTSTGILDNDGPDGGSLPITYGQWVEVRIEIDLDANLQSMYYGGTLLVQTSWTEGMSGGGTLNIAALDLFSNGATPIYYDDISLEGIMPTPVENTSWSRVKGHFAN